MLHSVLLAKLIHHIQKPLVTLDSALVNVNTLDVLAELNVSMYLHLFVGSSAA